MRRTTSRFLVLMSFWFASIPAGALGAVPAHLWSQRFGDANGQFAYAVATDGSGM